MGILDGRKIIITGGSSGIGLATVALAAQEGADVAFCGLPGDDPRPAQEAVRAAGRLAYHEAFDLVDLERTRAFATNAIAALGGLDGLVNNAGANIWRGVAGSTYDDIQRCLHVNFYHAWALAQEAHAAMKARGWGMIVNVASVHATRTLPGVFPYSLAKAMVLSLTQSIAMEWGRDNIQCVAIQPGFIMTPMNEPILRVSGDPAAELRKWERRAPLNRAGRAEDVGSTIVHLLSGQDKFVSGASIVIDGGQGTMLQTPEGW